MMPLIYLASNSVTRTLHLSYEQIEEGGRVGYRVNGCGNNVTKETPWLCLETFVLQLILAYMMLERETEQTNC